MLKIQRFVFNMFAENTYVISDETKECIFLDCGAFYSEERAAVRRYIETETDSPFMFPWSFGSCTWQWLSLSRIWIEGGSARR